MMKQTAFFPRFSFGGAVYCLTEFLWRGRSHVSMFVLGGLCFLALCALARSGGTLLRKALLGAAVVTAAEFCSGLLLNRVLRLNVWDYSAMRVQLLGQICLLYSLLWIPLSAAGILLAQLIDRVCRMQAARQARRPRRAP